MGCFIRKGSFLGQPGTALIWAVGSMYAEPDYDVPLGKSPFNKRFLDKSIKQTKELKSLAVKILKRHRLHDSQTPTCENVCFKIQGEKINFWESNCIDGIKVEKYSFIDFKDGDNPMVLTLKSLKKAGKELEKTLKYDIRLGRARSIFWGALYEHCEAMEKVDGLSSSCGEGG